MQTHNDPKIGERTLTYGGSALKHHGAVPIHAIIYIGAEPCSMPVVFEREQYSIRYALVSARDRDAEEIYAVGTISAVIFSFLCNIREPETYVDKALRRMHELTPGFWARVKAISILWVLLQLRDKSLRKMVKRKLSALYA